MLFAANEMSKLGEQPLCKNREILERFLERKIELFPMFPLISSLEELSNWSHRLICLSSPGRTN